METNTALGLAFIQAQQKANQQEKQVEMQVETKDDRSNAQKVYEYLQDEGMARAVNEISLALGMDKQVVSVSVHQLKKSGYVEGIPTLNGYMTYKAGDTTYGSLRKGMKYKKNKASQVVTADKVEVVVKKPEPRMVAMPAPAGVKLVVNTGEQTYSFGVKEARAIHKELNALFGGSSVSFDD